MLLCARRPLSTAFIALAGIKSCCLFSGHLLILAAAAGTQSLAAFSAPVEGRDGRLRAK